MDKFLHRLSPFLSYKTIKIVQINDIRLGIIHYLVQLIIVGYIIGYVIIYDKGYQSEGDLVGTTSIKIKGNVLFNGSQIWDEQEIVFPPQEVDAFFVTTNFVPTYGQSRNICPSTNIDAFCNATSPSCSPDKYYQMGVPNGTCDFSTSRCFMNAWCPMENDFDMGNYLDPVEQFTVFAKINVQFPKYNIGVSNTNGTKGQTTKGFNLWTIADMLQMAGTSFNEIKANGAILLVTAHFECNFDRSSSECVPSFSFARIDAVSALSPGFNFRYVDHYWMPDPTVTDGPLPGHRQYRDLLKVYGIRTIYVINGTGAKFDIVPLILNLASGLALLGVATVICDFLALYIMPEKKKYNHAKYEDVEQDVQNSEVQPLIS